ncbi:MAG: zf-HC2 domain-containing protein [Sedimentisphaerales bacterium]|nr:zf-HC2 domain-containing protein [Sedimentisphaerales bacterium]
MNTHDKINELLTTFALGELSPQESSDVETHLAECPQCASELEELRTVLECADAMSRLSADEQTCQSAKQRIFEATASKQTSKPPAAIESIWRMIMTTKKFRLAAAAIIVIAAILGLAPFLGGTVTFADVIKPILNARTIVFDVVFGNDEASPVMHEEVAGSLIRRTVSNIPNMVMILDLDNRKMLALDTAAKTAGYVEIGKVGDKTQNYIEGVRRIIVELQEKKGDVEKLAECEIDGRKAIGFKGGNPKEKLTVWADPKTVLPIRVEHEIGQLHIVFKNFEFDRQIEEIGMDVPRGYTLDNAQLDLSDAAEQDLIESLRIWAEIILDGTFPDAIGTDHYMKQIAVLGQKIPRLDIPDSEKVQLGFKFGKGMIFLQKFEFGGKWHYAGKGVKLGNADKVILWYKPEGSSAYRAIYGDLKAADISQENLPK